MYQVFGSQLYRNQMILEADDPLEDDGTASDDGFPDDGSPDDGSLDDTDMSSNDGQDTTSDNTATPQDDDPLAGGDDDQQPSPEEQAVANFQAIQKFILYHKLRELQYKIEDLKTINLYKDKEALVTFSKFLSYVIMFFSIFDYKQASTLTEKILAEFKKIK